MAAIHPRCVGVSRPSVFKPFRIMSASLNRERGSSPARASRQRASARSACQCDSRVRAAKFADSEAVDSGDRTRIVALALACSPDQQVDRQT